MDRKKKITGMILTVLAFACISLCVPMVFSLNDDVTMKHMVSGVYTGRPEAHLVYMAYPLTWILQLLYRVLPMVPWFSLFLNGCLIVCCLLIGNEFQKQAHTKSGFAMLTAGWLELIAVLVIYPYMNLHYTVVAAMLGGTAVFLMVRGKWDCTGKRFRQQILPSLILLAVCYMVRSNICYLCLPFVAVALLWNMMKTEKAWSREPIFRGLSFAAALAGMLLLLAAGNRIAYGSEPWKQYLKYNDSRTEVYDYTNVLSYEAFPEVYDSLQLTEGQYELLAAYHTVLDERIRADTLSALAQAVKDLQVDAGIQKAIIKAAVKEYGYRLVNHLDRPYNIMVLGLYVAVFLLCIPAGSGRYVIAPLTLALGRNGIWLYLIYRGRYPERITVSLYMMEILLLTGILAELAGVVCKRGQRQAKAGKLLWCAGLAVLLPVSVMQLHRSYADACKQQEKNKEWQAVTEYCTAHEDKVYFIDVYSAVPYSEGQYTMQAEPENYVLLGGWLTQSPALADKLERLGMNPAAEGLLRGNGYFICRDNRPLDWITGYYASIGRRVVISEKDRLTVNKDCTFIIYQISQSDADA